MDYDNTKASALIGILVGALTFGISYGIACFWGKYFLFPDVTELNWTTAMDFAVYAYVNANLVGWCWLVGGIFYGGTVGIGLIMDLACEY